MNQIINNTESIQFARRSLVVNLKRRFSFGSVNKRGIYDGKPMTLRQIPINHNGKDLLGTYWGIGPRLYRVVSQDREIEITFRANDSEGAMRFVRRIYPDAMFYT